MWCKTEISSISGSASDGIRAITPEFPTPNDTILPSFLPHIRSKRDYILPLNSIRLNIGKSTMKVRGKASSFFQD
jgi:hypothetical protein